MANGELWRMGDMFQLSLELYDTKDKKIVWSDRWHEKWDNLPKNAQLYINFIKNYCGVKISSISTSPKREDTILLVNPFKKI